MHSLVTPSRLARGSALALLDRLGNGVRLARAKQPELHADTTSLAPADDGRKPHCRFGPGQGPDHHELSPKLRRIAALDVHATQAHVLGRTSELGAIAELTDHLDVDGDSSMNALLVHWGSRWRMLMEGTAAALSAERNPPYGTQGCQVE